MTPILYPSTETQFDSNGIGIMADAVSCKVTEELNGGYELVMQYPIDGIHYGEIQQRCILYCDANTGNKQPFRVYRITKPHNGIVTIYAVHISYDLSGIPVKPFTAGSAAGAMAALETGAAVPSPFAFWTDKTNAGNLTVATPLSSRFVLGGGDNPILGVYGGELEFDRYTIKLHSERGMDRGVSIRYGKNLTSLEQDENNSNVYTGVYPYYVDADGNLTQLDELIVPAPGTYDYEKILTLDLSGEFENTPTKAQLKAAAESYIQHNNIGIPEIFLVLSFAQLDQTEEYRDKALLERVYLGDTVSIEFAALGVSAKAKCVKTIYNVLLDRHDAIELGGAKKSFPDTAFKQQQAINAVASQPVSTAMQNAINAATALITGNKGGYVILHSSTGDKQPDEILIMDKPDIASAVKVWRWNKSGLGYSSTGYNGPYGTAITQDGQIVADFITVGGMNAAHITAGVLASDDGRVQFDLTAGTLYVKGDDGTIKLGFDKTGALTVRGTVYATGGEFTGKVTATSGKIGGLTINADGSLESNYMSIYPTVVNLLGTRGVGLELYGKTILSDGNYLHLYSDTHVHGELTIDNGLHITDLGGGDVDIDTDIDIAGDIFTDLPSSEGGNTVYWGANTRRFVYHGSSRRYKEEINTITYDEALKLLDVRPVSFYYKKDPDMPSTLQYGVIAEELEKIYPSMVGYKNGQVDSAYYEQFFGPIIKLLQIHEQRLNWIEGSNRLCSK